MKVKESRKITRITSLMLCCAVMFSSINIFAFANNMSADDSKLCANHPAHTEECGYSKEDGVPCSHEHSEECYKQIIKNCVHVHTEECYPKDDEENKESSEDSESTAPEIPSDKDADDEGNTSVENGDKEKDTESEERIPSACTHVCTVESGCITVIQEEMEEPEQKETSITAWRWIDEEEILTRHGDEWFLSLPGADMQDLNEDLLSEILPKEVFVILSDGKKDTLPLIWDFSSLFGGEETGESSEESSGESSEENSGESSEENSGESSEESSGESSEENSGESSEESSGESSEESSGESSEENSEESSEENSEESSEDGSDNLTSVSILKNIFKVSDEPTDSEDSSANKSEENSEESPKKNTEENSEASSEENSKENIEENLEESAEEDNDVEKDKADSSEEFSCEGIYRLNAAIGGDYPMADGVLPPYVLLTFGEAEVYLDPPSGNYPGNRTQLNAQELEKALQDYKVKGITPEGSTLNLFDYVATRDGATEKDVMGDSDFYKKSPIKYTKEETWNKGINEDRPLIFTFSNIGTGYWNIGAGAGRKWARDNTNMKGIVEKTLPPDGYPKIDLDNAQKPIYQKPGVQYAENEFPVNIKYAEVTNEENLTPQVEPKAAKALSDKMYDRAVDDPSLAYLFDPNVDLGDVKRSYENVTGLFQMDENGYYYYDARKNFAEFNKTEGAESKDGRPSDGSFTLYKGGAIWRTDSGWNEKTGKFDGDKSLGNFFPFNKGREVFDCIDTDNDCLSSMETRLVGGSGGYYEGLDSQYWSADSAYHTTNAATRQNVNLNHHMGMSFEIDFAQTDNGQLNMGSSGKQDMVFQFSGDDDIWVFIDDVLVLDLGGIHSELYGTINFATGEVVTGQSWRFGGLPATFGNNLGDESTNLYDLFKAALGQTEADKLFTNGATGGKIFPTGTEHKLKLFYLERGNYDSSLCLRFNIQPKMYHEIKKVDQEGEPLEGVEFELYPAGIKAGTTKPTDQLIADVDAFEITGAKIGTMKTGKNGKTDFVQDTADGSTSPFSFSDKFYADGTIYYILKESRTVDGYRTLPKDIVIKYDANSTVLSVMNRYQTGAHASFFSHIRESGTLTYGHFDTGSGAIEPDKGNPLPDANKKNGLIIAVPMLLVKNMDANAITTPGKWVALYGSNTSGYEAVVPEARTAEAWRKVIVKAALYQASDPSWPKWYIGYNDDMGVLEDLLEDLPGRADRYALTNPDGDMKMVYGILEPSALEKLGITGATSKERYENLENYVKNQIQSGKTIDDIANLINTTGAGFVNRDFSFLNTNQFQREFRATIYIPNERREIRVWKVDDNGIGINGAEFTLYDDNNHAVVTGTTSRVGDRDGVLIFGPNATANTPGYANVKWTESQSTRYVLKETKAPAGHKLNQTEIPVIVGKYSIYAGAGEVNDGVTVMAGVGKLMQTMAKYAMDNIVNKTLRDITAIAQTQDSLENFGLEKWEDNLLAETAIPRSMNLHYGKNVMIDYGLHDEDGGKNMYPFFTTDTGFLRARIKQNGEALAKELYDNPNDPYYLTNFANYDDLGDTDITSLFSQINIVVVTDKKDVLPDTGRLLISKIISGNGLADADFKKKYSFNVSLKNPDGTPLTGEYYYYGDNRSGYISNEGTLYLGHDESLTVLGLPSGTKWEIKEEPKPGTGWYVVPLSGVISGSIAKDETSYAEFTNYKGVLPTGNLTVSKTVDGDNGDKQKEFNFTVTLNDTLTGTYGDMTFTDGVAKFKLKHSESKTATGLPAGIRYTVAETEANQEGYTTTSTGETGKIEKDQTEKAEFTNTYDGTLPVTGNLVVSKTVFGSHASTTKDFTFTIALEDTSVNGKYGDMTFTGGEAKFKLKHGESKTAVGLPADIKYTVTESNNTGYEVTSTGETGIIKADETVTADFRNYRGGGGEDDNYIDVTVKKVWRLNDGGAASDYVNVVLLKDGKLYDRAVLNKQNDWKHTWYNLSDRHIWGVIEEDVPKGFTMSVKQRGYVFTITNDDVGETTDDVGETTPPYPVNSDEPVKPIAPKDNTAETGDNSHPLLWIVLLIASGLGMIFALVPEEKRRNFKSKD